MVHTSILRAEQVSTICPTKVPMRGGATFINEGLASFEGSIGDRADLKGSGIAECAYSIFLSACFRCQTVKRLSGLLVVVGVGIGPTCFWMLHRRSCDVSQ